MRIALAVTEFPSASQTFVRDHAAGLVARGHTVSLHALMQGAALEPPASAATAAILPSYYAPPPLAGSSRPQRWRLLLQNYAPTLLSHPGLLRIVLADRSGHRLERLRRWQTFATRRGRIDLIHAHSGYNGERLLPLYEAGFLKSPLVVTFHGYDVHAYLRQRPADHYAPLFAGASALVVCSELMRARLTALGAPVHKLHLIANGVDLSGIAFAPRPRQPGATLRLLSVGRLVPFKGLAVLVEALRLCAEQLPAWQLDVIGDGPLRTALDQQAKTAGLSQSIRFHGALPQAAVLRQMAHSDLFLAPAIVDAEGNTETQGMALVEALAVGLPVLASAAGAIPETVGGHAVALTPPGDAAALAEALVTWATADPQAQARAEQGRQHVETRYSAARWLTALEHLYDAVAGRAAAASVR